jgi:hypothetical protein
VTALLGVSGWLAGLFALGFVAVTFRPEHAPAFGLLGLVLLALALPVLRAAEGAFLEQGALALSIAGHGLLAAAAYEATDSAAATAWSVAVFQVAWIVVVGARLPRLLSTLFAVLAISVAVRLLVGDDVHHLGRRAAPVGLASALLGWLAVWVPLCAAAGLLVAREVRWMAAGLQRVLRPVLTGLLVALALVSPASHPLDGLVFWETEARLGWLALWPLLSLGAALFALWLAHRLRSAALVGTAIAGALLHVFHFYLLLGLPLVTKAAVLVVLGAALVLGALALRRREAR